MGRKDVNKVALEPADSNLPQWIRSASERTDIINARLVGQAEAIIKILSAALVVEVNSLDLEWAERAAKIWLETNERTKGNESGPRFISPAEGYSESNERFKR